ncbi:MAG TPA: ATP-binding protein [Gemmatimonadales bacterium]
MTLSHHGTNRDEPHDAGTSDAGTSDAGTSDVRELGRIATLLAEAAFSDDALPAALAGIATLLGARECILRDAPVEPSPSGAVAMALVPIELDGRLLGTLELRGLDVVPPALRPALDVVRSMLVQRLAHAERMRELEHELARRAHEMEEERHFTQRIIDSLPLSLYVIDRDYRIQAWNRWRETGLQGVSRDDAIGRTVFEILHRQPATMLRREFEEVLETGEVQHFSMESTSTGDLRYYRITKIPMRVHGDDVTHVITIGEDVTDWREAQERFAQAEKLAAIGQLAAGVMHEINNPLATIAACAESLGLTLDDMRRGGTVIPPEGGEYLRIVEGEVQRSKRIVDRLLEFSRPKPLTPEPVDLNAVVEQTLFLLKHHSRFKSFTVETVLSEPPPVARGNGEQLVQVLMALLINAMDASPDTGIIELRSLSLDGDAPQVAIEVRDRGHGIPRRQMAKIFEPFYTTKAPGRGTGLGLSICYGIVSEHGGRLEVESEEGEGSTFRILLPAAR